MERADSQGHSLSLLCRGKEEGWHVKGINISLSPCPGGVRTSEAPILPYVPYPTCPATGSPPATCLPALQPRRTSQLGAVMTDPVTGIEVPVLAVTLHPQTRQWLTLGGTYYNPLTKTLTPLELGGPMEDPVTGGIAPILGVGLDENTGLLTALGAVLPASPPCLPDSPISPLQLPGILVQAANSTPSPTFPSTIFCVPLIPTFPPLPCSPRPFFISGTVPQEGKRELSQFCCRTKSMFSTKRGHHFSSCHHHVLPICSLPPVTHSTHRPWNSLLPHLSATLLHPLPTSTSRVPTFRSGAGTGRATRCLRKPHAAW